MIPLSELSFKFGDVVFHKTDGDCPGIVIGILQRAGGAVLYEIIWQGRTTDIHLGIEITDERPNFSASDPTDT